MHAWLCREDELNFYSELHNPVIDGGPVDYRIQVFLNGWQIYTWKGSVIYGYCCITNNGTTEQTASLYFFTNDSDVINFVNGLGARNTILSESLTIPPGRQECFNKWGTDAPYTVTRNSYHFIGVDVPPESIYSTNITVDQTSVNTTNLGTPHYFKFNNGTEFRISKRLFWNENFVAVCEAPSDIALVEDANILNVSRNESAVVSSLASMVGTQSVHINSCKLPYPWNRTSIIIVAVGIGGVFASIVTFVVKCYCMWKVHRKRLCLSETCRKLPAQTQHGQSIQSEDAATPLLQ